MSKPDNVGPYTLLSPLSESARARAWLARIGEGPEHVLKWAHEDDATGRARLQHEIDIVAGLDHPNVVRMLERGDTRGTLWMALPKVGVGQAPFELAHFRQLVLALVHLHAHGVVHADIKPANLLLDDEGNLQVIGFGNARRIGAGPLPPGGMPQYMSPEQLRSEALDVRADVFSAGAVLYQVLTGKRPFDGTASEATEDTVETGLLPPSALVDGFGTGFDELTSKMLAADRAERQDSAFAVLAQFDAACAQIARSSIIDCTATA
ncbi:MAG: serine/threonine-protein kinase, partial [Telluria sp.]